MATVQCDYKIADFENPQLNSIRQSYVNDFF